MDTMLTMLRQWQLDVGAVRERMYRAPTPRERERWHAIWLVARGWSAAQVAEALERDAFVAAYAKLRTEAQSTGARIFFVDEAHFRADADLRAKWVLRVKHTEPLIVIWDNSPAHRGPEIRAYVATPDLKLRLVALPAYSPDLNPDEAIWDWAREEVTANTCFGTAAKVQEKMDAFFVGLAERAEEAQRRCRTKLQAQADALMATANQLLGQTDHVDPTLVSV
jgi:hypothetical protein